jgi:superfamily II DNA or RNA helicase
VTDQLALPLRQPSDMEVWWRARVAASRPRVPRGGSVTPWLGNTPRRWQPEALEAARAAFRSGLRRVVVQAATGAGKSLWLAEVCATARGRVLLTTPTQALVDQLSAVVQARCGDVGRYYQHERSPEARVVVTCAASLPRLLAEQPTWDLWLSDEAHRRVVGPECRAVALTATPFRGLEGWERLVYAYTAAQAEAEGVLVPLRPVRYEGTHEHLPEDQRTDAVVREWVAAAEGPGVVTAVTVADAHAFAATCPGVEVVSGYMPRAAQLAAIERLQRGECKALATVRLLSEGVDIPALRWLALRVPVTSPIRLVQLVGRVLRAAPNKAEAVIYDPHNALGLVGLTHTARLDDVLATAPEEEPEQWEIPELEGLGLAGLPAPAAVSRLEGWVGDLRARFVAAGWELRPRAEGRDWRECAVLPAQRQRLAVLSGRAVGRLPGDYREPFRWLLERQDLKRGPAQDAIDVLTAVAARHRVEIARGRPWWKVAAELVPVVPREAA